MSADTNGTLRRHAGSNHRVQSGGAFLQGGYDMFGLTPLGTLHTAISLVAVVAGFVALARHREISTGNNSGSIFFWGTVISCLTGFGIFQHGGFGKPHV